MSDYHFTVSDHFATGEGNTINLMVTPSHYEPKFVEELFVKAFDSYYLGSFQFVAKEEFFEYAPYLPPKVLSIINKEVLTPANFSWYSSFHISFF
jgi:hypothetical protein